MRVVDIITGTVIDQGKPYMMRGAEKALVVEEAIVNALGKAKIKVRLGKSTCSCNERVVIEGRMNPSTGDIEFSMPWGKT